MEFVAGMGVKHIKEVWPNLRVLFGGGVPADPYKQIIEERVGRPIALSEGRVAPREVRSTGARTTSGSFAARLGRS